MITKTKILYVDDELVNLQLFDINFSKKYEVITASDGFKGLEALINQPDILVVFSDMKMPGLSGIEFISKAKGTFPSKNYYLVTGFEITSEIQNALENGLILKYFRKPFSVEELESVIEESIK